MGSGGAPGSSRYVGGNARDRRGGSESAARPLRNRGTPGARFVPRCGSRVPGSAFASWITTGMPRVYPAMQALKAAYPPVPMISCDCSFRRMRRAANTPAGSVAIARSFPRHPWRAHGQPGMVTSFSPRAGTRSDSSPALQPIKYPEAPHSSRYARKNSIAGRMWPAVPPPVTAIRLCAVGLIKVVF